MHSLSRSLLAPTLFLTLATTASAQLSSVDSLLLHQDVAGVTGNAGNADDFGDPLASGDFDGDGIADLAVGVPGEFVGSSDGAGAVHVFLGGGDPLDLTSDQILHQDDAGVPGVAEAGDAFGAALAVGDFDGDGFDDLAVGAPGEAIGSAAAAGAAWVFFGSANGLHGSGRSALSFDQSDFWPDENPEANDRFGFSLAAGDFEGDGLDDLAIGVPGEDLLLFTTDGGTIHVLFSAVTSSPLALSWTITQGEVDSTNGTWDPTPAETPESFDLYGFALASADFDGDGRDDLAISAPFEELDGVGSTGIVEVLFGSDVIVPFSIDRSALLHQNALGVTGSCEPGDRLGGTLATGDFDGDGLADLVAGVAGESIGSLQDAGAVAVFFGPFPTLSSIDDQFFSQDDPIAIAGVAETGDHLGAALAVGDFDADGFDDLAIGVPDEDLGSTSNAGAVNVLYGGTNGLGSAGNQLFDQSTSGVGNPGEANDHYGAALAAGDFDGDGVADLAIGVPGEEVANAATNHGAVVILRRN